MAIITIKTPNKPSPFTRGTLLTIPTLSINCVRMLLLGIIMMMLGLVLDGILLLQMLMEPLLGLFLVMLLKLLIQMTLGFMFLPSTALK